MRNAFVAVIGLVLLTHDVAAQEQRRRSPGGEQPPAAERGVPRNPNFPYAGLWKGMRTMPMGHDSIGLSFVVENGKYAGVTLYNGGGGRGLPRTSVSSTAAGLTWEQPNSGGGRWVYRVRLVGPDSMTGTLELADAPANFNPVPKGTLVLTRQGVVNRGR
jgi:hypothetical protein